MWAKLKIPAIIKAFSDHHFVTILTEMSQKESKNVIFTSLLSELNNLTDGRIFLQSGSADSFK